MKRVSEVLEQMLIAQGMSAGTAGTVNAHGMEGPGAAMERAHRGGVAGRREGFSSPPIGHAGEDRRPTGIEKDAGERSPRQVGGQGTFELRQFQNREGEPFPGYVADAVAMATRNGRIVRTRPFLVIIDGGRA